LNPTGDLQNRRRLVAVILGETTHGGDAGAIRKVEEQREKQMKTAAHPKVFGAPYSVYVRAVRLVLEEKGAYYELIPVEQVPTRHEPRTIGTGQTPAMR
jgi:hypothetical protein